MKVEKDTANEKVVGNNDNKTSKPQQKKKNTQFSTTIPTDLYEEVEEFCQNRSIDRSKLIENHLLRAITDEEYLRSFLFPYSKEQEQITTQQTTQNDRQENNFEV